MNWPAYTEYRHAGSSVLPPIPTHWDLAPVKRLGTIRYGIGEPPPYAEVGTPLIRATNVSSGRIVEEGLVYVDPDDISPRRILWLQVDDIIVVRSGAYTGDSARVTDKYAGAIAGFDMVLRVSIAIPAFVQYALLSGYLKQGQIDISRTRAAQPHLNAEELGQCLCILPSLSEQQDIIRFLDRQTGKIDALIDKQEQLIATLREYRTATINHAVTKGLDPDVEMTDSGLAWVRQVPRHWQVVNIRRVALMKTGHTPSRSVPAYWENTTIPWFTLADVWQLRDGKRIYLGETSNCISELGLANSAAELLPEGTVVLSRTASVGFTGIMPGPMATSQDYWNWVCGPQLLPEYLTYVFRAMQDYFSALMTGSTHQTIYQADAAGIRIPLPPVSEQQKIAQRISDEVAAIDALSAKANEVIQTLREYRSTLITDAVTGKIDVRQAV